MGDGAGYKTIAVLGRGGFGVVKKVQRVTDLEVRLPFFNLAAKEGQSTLTRFHMEALTSLSGSGMQDPPLSGR